MRRKTAYTALFTIICGSDAFSPTLTTHHVHKTYSRHCTRRRIHSSLATKQNDDSDDDIYPREGSLAAATKELGSVPYGETSRKYRRTQFTHKDWVQHRSSSSRILSNLMSMFGSGVVRQLRPQVTAVTLSAIVVLVWNYIATNFDLHLPLLALPTLPFTLSSPALGLLLVFRTNAAYARWMRGRDYWVRIITHCKNIVRMALVFSSDEDAVDELSKVVWLYARSVMNKLSSPLEDEEVYKQQVRDVFGPESNIAEKVIASPDRPIQAWKQLSVALHALPASDPKALIETDKSIIILGECTSTCEKIYSSPVPLVYTRHTARFLSLYVLLLPWGLYSAFSAHTIWAVLPASMIMAFFLCGVDELSMQLEEPFSILPQQAFCDEVMEANLILLDREDSEG